MSHPGLVRKGVSAIPIPFGNKKGQIVGKCHEGVTDLVDNLCTYLEKNGLNSYVSFRIRMMRSFLH